VIPAFYNTAADEISSLDISRVVNPVSVIENIAMDIGNAFAFLILVS